MADDPERGKITKLADCEEGSRTFIENGDGFEIERNLSGEFDQECCSCGYKHVIGVRWTQEGAVQLTWSSDAELGVGASVIEAAVRVVDKLSGEMSFEELELELELAVEEYKGERS